MRRAHAVAVQSPVHMSEPAATPSTPTISNAASSAPLPVYVVVVLVIASVVAALVAAWRLRRSRLHWLDRLQSAKVLTHDFEMTHDFVDDEELFSSEDDTQQIGRCACTHGACSPNALYSPLCAPFYSRSCCAQEDEQWPQLVAYVKNGYRIINQPYQILAPRTRLASKIGISISHIVHR